MDESEDKDVPTISTQFRESPSSVWSHPQESSSTIYDHAEVETGRTPIKRLTKRVGGSVGRSLPSEHKTLSPDRGR